MEDALLEAISYRLSELERKYRVKIIIAPRISSLVLEVHVIADDSMHVFRVTRDVLMEDVGGFCRMLELHCQKRLGREEDPDERLRKAVESAVKELK